MSLCRLSEFGLIGTAEVYRPYLSCVSWNALYGIESKALKPGDVVLTQGTGGISIFAPQARQIGEAYTSIEKEY